MDRRRVLRGMLVGAGALTAPALAGRSRAFAQGRGNAGPARPSADRAQALNAMKRATAFMVEQVSTNGGYVWAYLPDRSRRWGELEAWDTMVWVQPPGTATMGHVFLDACHATGDDYYYQAAERVAGALIWGQHPSGGWNYMIDFAGDRSLRAWYDTVGRNAWRMEEFQHHWGNATFDDGGTADATRFLLRLYLEKHDPRYKPALDRAIRFVLDSQYPIGAWPQRYPVPPPHLATMAPAHDYTSYLTFNDDVAAENIDVLLLAYRTLGDQSLLDPITRAMNAFLVTQQGPPQPGWAMQYTGDFKPAAARTYEPNALTTHTTAANVELLIRFYRLTGETKFLARLPEALDWLEGLTLPPGIAPPGRTHPTFVEIGTNRPLYVHREGSNVVNGRYYADYDPRNTIAHYSSFRGVNVARLREMYRDARAQSPTDAVRDSPLAPGRGLQPPPRLFLADPPAAGGVDAAIAGLSPQGYWLSALGSNSYVYTADGSKSVTPGSFSQTYVGDRTDTSPFPDGTLTGISTDGYIRNMGVLLRYVDRAR